MRSRIVEEVVRRGPAELAGEARLLVARTGNLALQLLEVGYLPAAILDGACAATGLRQASPTWLREPSPPPVDYDDGLLFRQAAAAPVALEDGVLCVAFGDPVAAAESKQLGLPAHRAYLAMPAQLSRALALLPAEPTITEARPTEPTRRAAYAQRSAAPMADAFEGNDDPGDDEPPELEATRTVPGSAPPSAPPGATPEQPGDEDVPTVATNLGDLRRAASLGVLAPKGPASQDDLDFEDVRTQQVDLVSPAQRAAVEPTVTRTEASAFRAPKAAHKQPLADDDDDYEDVATIAMSHDGLRAIVAANRVAKGAADRAAAHAANDPADHAAKSAPASTVQPPAKRAVEENPFDDPTEHVGVLASREELAAAKTAPRRPASALLTEPTPPPSPARILPAQPAEPARAGSSSSPASPRPGSLGPPAPARPEPSRPVPGPPRVARGADLGETQPMPRHQPTTESEVVPVPGRGGSPLVSALSAVGRTLADDAQPLARPSAPGSKRIPALDAAAPAGRAQKHIPGFDDALDAKAPHSPPTERKRRSVLLHPPDDRVGGRSSLAEQQETEAEHVAPGPMPLDPSALQPMPVGPSALRTQGDAGQRDANQYDANQYDANQYDDDDGQHDGGQHDGGQYDGGQYDGGPAHGAESFAPIETTTPLDLMGAGGADFSRPPPAPLPLPPRPLAMPGLAGPQVPRIDQRGPARGMPADEHDPRGARRGGGPSGGLQVLRATAAPQAAPVLETVDEQPRAPAPAPRIPGIDSPLPYLEDQEQLARSSGDGRSRQILIGAVVVAILIVAGAGLIRARGTLGSRIADAPAAPAPRPTVLPPVPPPASSPAPPPAQGATPSSASKQQASPEAKGDAAAANGEPAARQQELIEEARRHADPVMAIALYSAAIELSPNTLVGRDALFERAKLYLATGNGAQARADVFKLKRREDSKELERDLQLILDGVPQNGGRP